MAKGYHCRCYIGRTTCLNVLLPLIYRVGVIQKLRYDTKENCCTFFICLTFIWHLPSGLLYKISLRQVSKSCSPTVIIYLSMKNVEEYFFTESTGDPYNTLYEIANCWTPAPLDYCRYQDSFVNVHSLERKTQNTPLFGPR